MSFIEDHTKLSQAFHKFVTENAFLFRNSKGFVSLGEYIDFIKTKDFSYQSLSVPTSYKLESLKQFKDKIVCTSYFFTAAGARQYYTILQLDLKNHIFVYYSYDEVGEFNANYDFMVNDVDIFFKFLEENQKYSIENDRPTNTYGFASFIPK